MNRRLTIALVLCPALPASSGYAPFGIELHSLGGLLAERR